MLFRSVFATLVSLSGAVPDENPQTSLVQSALPALEMHMVSIKEDAAFHMGMQVSVDVFNAISNLTNEADMMPMTPSSQGSSAMPLEGASAPNE